MANYSRPWQSPLWLVRFYIFKHSLYTNKVLLIKFRALILSLDAKEYSFKSGVDGSSLSIEMDATCVTTECEGFFVFSVGDQQ